MNLDEIRLHMRERDFAANGLFPRQQPGEGLDDVRRRVLMQLADDVPGLVVEIESRESQLREWYGKLTARDEEVTKLNLQIGEARELLEQAMAWTGVDPTAYDAKRIHVLEQKILDFLSKTEKQPANRECDKK